MTEKFPKFSERLEWYSKVSNRNSERKMCLPFAIFTSSKLHSKLDVCHVSFNRGCANGTRRS